MLITTWLVALFTIGSWERFHFCKKENLFLPINESECEMCSYVLVFFMRMFVVLTLFLIAVDEFSAPHIQVILLHCDLQPAEGAIQPSNQQVLCSRSVLIIGHWVQNTQAKGLSPTEGGDSRPVSLHMTVRSCEDTDTFNFYITDSNMKMDQLDTLHRYTNTICITSVRIQKIRHASDVHDIDVFVLWGSQEVSSSAPIYRRHVIKCIAWSVHLTAESQRKDRFKTRNHNP